jgi:hypothetical protein
MLKLNTGICPIVDCNTYNSDLELDCECVEDNLREQGNSDEVIARFLDRMWLKHDGTKFIETVCKEAIESVNNAYINGGLDSVKNNFPGIKGFQFDSAYSPREYNFSGDEANFSLIGDTEAIIADCHKIIAKDEEKFFEFIYKQFGSRSGFISHMPYGKEDFWEALDKGTDVERAVSMVIAFVLDEDEVKNIYDDLVESIHGNHDILDFVNYTVEDAQRELDMEKVEEGE